MQVARHRVEFWVAQVANHLTFFPIKMEYFIIINFVLPSSLGFSLLELATHGLEEWLPCRRSLNMLLFSKLISSLANSPDSPQSMSTDPMS